MALEAWFGSNTRACSTKNPRITTAMEDKRVHRTYYYWGILFLSMAVLGLIGGKTLSFDDDDLTLFELVTNVDSPVEFYAMTLLYAFLALVLFYRSLLFLGTNREDLMASDGFDRRVVGLEPPANGVSIARVMSIVVLSLLIVTSVYLVYFKTASIAGWLSDKPEEPKIQRPEKIDCGNLPGRCF